MEVCAIVHVILINISISLMIPVMIAMLSVHLAVHCLYARHVFLQMFITTLSAIQHVRNSIILILVYSANNVHPIALLAQVQQLALNAWVLITLHHLQTQPALHNVNHMNI